MLKINISVTFKAHSIGFGRYSTKKKDTHVMIKFETFFLCSCFYLLDFI